MKTQENSALSPIGRFAPSPTGPLHFGSLVTALASFLNCKAAGGQWLLRIEDIDEPRCVTGATDEILRCLEAYALPWDGEIIYQSQRQDIYERYWHELINKERVYPCTCPRHRTRELSDGYDKHCLYHPPDLNHAHAWRVHTEQKYVSFVDALIGEQSLALDDFIVKRKDKRFAYQLVVVVDDIEQGITEVVRGVDLLDSTPRQITLFEIFAQPCPNWWHLPLVAVAPGNRSYDPKHPVKLSKQHGAEPVALDRVSETLYQALLCLGQKPYRELTHSSAESIIAWALSHWQADLVPRQTFYPVSEPLIP